MPYLNETGLAHYDPKLKEWIASQPVKTLPSSLYPWTLTEKAGAVTCWPVGGTELKPTVDFLFSETGPSSGTKGPDNPSTITGVSTITVTRCETVGVDSTDYTIDLSSTYYGGTLDVSTGVMTVTWGANAFDGTENWELDSSSTETVNVFRLANTPLVPMSVTLSSATRACSHCAFSTATPPVGGTFSTWAANPRVFIRRAVSEIADVTAFKAWLVAQNTNGTPVTIAYVLNTPQTVQLTPQQILALAQTDKFTPRVNTVYTDASAVQVGYVKSPIREEYELTQAIVAQGGNI